MKTRIKIALRTKIYLTIGGLLTLAGILYAANPTPFSSAVPFPTGVAVSQDQLLMTPYCEDAIYSIDCNGNATLYANIPGFGSCREKYLVLAPSQSAAAGFTPRDAFVTQGALIYKVHEGKATLFTEIQGCLGTDHNGITFDHFGTYGFDMIVTCMEGNVFRVNGTGTATQIASLFPGGGGMLEGPAVVPLLFGPHGGEIWVADEVNNAVHTIGPPPTYTVTMNVLSHVTAEGVYVIPNRPSPSTYCGNGLYLAEQQQFQMLWAYPLSDFDGLGNKVIITSETGGDGADTSLVTFDGLNYVQTSFGPRVPGVNEGSSMVDPDVPTATPTPTATFTPTATPTPTATATFTPTPTATATFTPTPTPTPTSTPEIVSSTPTPAPACQSLTSISGNFNGTAISSSNFIWFSSVLKANGLPASTPVTITFTNQTITSPSFGPVSVPDASVTFDPAAVTATTNFSGGMWVTTVPPSLGGNTFLSGLSFPVPVKLTGIKNVTWNGTISVNTPGVSVNWQWAAANYPTFDTAYNALGVKPVDDNKASQYKNSDHAGTPQNFKQFVVGGATGGGGSNYTGSYSSTASVCR